MSFVNNTPNPADGFSRYMAELFDEKKVIGVPTGFQAFFGNPANGAETLFSPDANVVDIDIIRGNERTAALIPRGMVSRPLGSTQKNLMTEKFTSFSRKFPLSEEEADISADQLINRQAGEGAYERRTRIERLRNVGLKVYHEMIRRHVRLFERLAASSVLDGSQPAILGTSNTDLIYDFRRNTDNAYAAATAWDDTSPDVLGDIDAACALARKNGKVSPDMMVMGSSVPAVMFADTVFAAWADKNKYNFVEAGMDISLPPQFARFIAAGFIYRGRLQTPNGYRLHMFTYPEFYTNESGVATEYMTADEVLICSSRARADRYFGPSEVLPWTPARAQLYEEMLGFSLDMPPMPPNVKGENIIDSSMFYADAYISEDNKRLTFRTQSAPIFATTQTDAFVVMSQIIT